MKYEQAREYVPTLLRAPERLFLAPHIPRDLDRSIGSRPPEVGGLCFGPWDKEGIDLIEIDEPGTSRSSSSVYKPDTAWADRRRKYHLEDAPQGQERALAAVVHSHPSGCVTPSPERGPNRGDLAMAKAHLAADPWRRFVFMPIVCGTHREAQLWSWLVRRGSNQLEYADVQIAEASSFPIREAISDRAGLAATPWGELVDEVARVLAADSNWTGERWQLSLRGTPVSLEFPPTFPVAPPRISVVGDKRRHPIRWRADDGGALALRVAVEIDHLAAIARRSR